MKLQKTILACILVLALCLSLFASCSKQTTSTTQPSQTNTSTNTTNEAEKAEEPEPAASSEPEPEEPDETPVVQMLFFDITASGDNAEHISKAINDYIEPKYNVHLDITWMQVGDWLQKALMIVASGERMDLMELMPANTVSVMQKTNQLMDISELMTKYAPETYAMMEQYLDAYRYDGKLLGVPTLRNYCTNSYVIFRKDLLEDLGMVEQAENCSSWSEYEALLAAFTEAYSGSGIWAVTKGSDGSCPVGLYTGDDFSTRIVYDTVGDSLNLIMTDSEGNVSNAIASPYHEAALQRVRKWMDNGWMYPDSPLIDDHPDDLMKQNVVFSTLQGSEMGIENNKGVVIGYDLVCPMISVGMVTTGTLTSWGFGIPVTAEEPEAAVKIMNAFYTDEKLMNLIIRGEEGVDFELVDGQVKYFEGSVYQEQDFLIGNNLLLYPAYGNGSDFFDRVAEVNASAPTSPYLGFALDTAELDLIVSNLSSVKDQYNQSLGCGLYTSELYQEYLSKLESAGISDYIDAIQAQLTAWLAENK